MRTHHMHGHQDHEYDEHAAARFEAEREGAGRPGPDGFGWRRGGPRGFAAALGGRGIGGRGIGPRGFGPGGPGGFGPGGFGPGGFGRGFGPGGFGPGGPGGPGRGRRGRGNVRAAVLALLTEEPRHGYSIMTELTDRSGGLWKPSPGSVYPVLQQLQDEGLVSVAESDGRRVFTLTDAGQTYVAEHADELREPWNVGDHGPRQRVKGLMHAAGALAVAVEQVARLSDDAQAAKALAVLEEARKAMYRILAEDPARPFEQPSAPGPVAG
jgi:DNA-binding PadR family transcriptional regulator